LLPSVVILAAALWSGREPGAVEEVSRTEAALRAHVTAQGLRQRGEPLAAYALFEQACRMGHEPSCGEVWVRIDMEVGLERVDARTKLAETAEGLVGAIDAESITARVYCPLSREDDLELALSRLRREDD
jgi:hypothetical protein